MACDVGVSLPGAAGGQAAGHLESEAQSGGL